MTIDQLRAQFKAGKLSAKDTIGNLTPYLINSKTKKAAEALINEVLGMPEEPADTSELDGQIARGWYKDEE